MKIYVVDASVLLTSLLEEKENAAKELQNLLERVEKKSVQVYSSCLLPLEIANGLRYTLKDKNLCQETFDKFSSLPISYFSFKIEHIQKALVLSYELKTSVYDTSYHVLAKLLSGTFLTADKEYYTKAKNLGSIEFFG